MVSASDYYPPMADLTDKGIRFTSNFLFLSSNAASSVSRSQVEHFIQEPDAYYRRLDGTYVLECNQKKPDFSRNTRFTLYRKVFVPTDANKYNQQSFITKHVVLKLVPIEQIQKYITDSLLNDFLVTTQSLDNLLIQDIGERASGIAYAFPNCPPPMANSVMTYAICEPLKARMITKGHPYMYVLKPVQKAMYNAMNLYSCFKSWYKAQNCDGHHGNNLDILDRGYKTNGKKIRHLFVSGDYVGATDNLHMDISQAVMIQLATEFRKQGHHAIAEAIIWESQGAVVYYPSHTKIPPVLQTNGQRMGSLLSFPILSLINASIVAY